MKSLTEETATAEPPQAGPTEMDAERISGLSARYIPFIPTPRHLVDDCAGHRCQIGSKSDKEITVGYDGGIPITATVTYFHLRAFGRTWAEAIASWRANKAASK